jgi:hypothetical protein
VIPPEQDAEFICQMEDILDLYSQPEDPNYPLVCFDETSKQMTKETHLPQAAAPGKVAREDYQYVRVVQDNLNTHVKASLYKKFPAPEARRILNRLEFHYTPKHGSWLNMAEIELSVLSRQCLDRRIPDKETLSSEIAAWEERRNRSCKTIEWRFTIQDARIKLRYLYPSLQE